MAAISNYGNNYTSNNYGAYNPNGPREDYRGASQQRQRQLGDYTNQLRSPQNVSNPYYDNSFNYNRSTSRDSHRNLSAGRPSRLNINNSLEPDRNPLSNQNYSEDVRSGQPQGSNIIRKKRDNGTSNNQADSWYIQNFNVGILPGMGNQPEVRRNDRMPTFDPKASQNRQNEQQNGSATYETYDRNPYALDGRPGNSRLAGIGSRLLNNEESPYEVQRGAPPQRPELRIPQGPQDYGTGNNAQNFQTPQYTLNRTFTQPNLRTPQYSRGGLENQGYLQEVQNESSEQRHSEKRYSRERQREPDNGGAKDIYGTNWLAERSRQEDDKKQKQKDELQRIYREQIEEKNRKKDEEKRRKLEEERREDERLRKENEEINKQFQAEQQQKKPRGSTNPNVQSIQQNPVTDDYQTQKKPQKHNYQFETSTENPIKRTTSAKPNDPEANAQIAKIEELIKAAADNHLADYIKGNTRLELYSDPEVNVHRTAFERYNYTLDTELQNMRRNLELQSNMIKNGLTAYKTQALISQELRVNAQRDLMKLREDLKIQQLEEQRRPYEEFDLMSNNLASGKNSKKSEKVGLRIPMKNYTRMQAFEEEGEDLGESHGFNLEVETTYVPVRGPESNFSNVKESHGANELMIMQGLKDGRGGSHANDAAMHKFGQLFPTHKNQSGENSLRSEANSLRAANKTSSSAKHRTVDGEEHNHSYLKGYSQTKPGEKIYKESYSNLEHDAEGETQRLDGLLDTYQDKNEYSHRSHQSLRQNDSKRGGELPIRHEEKVQKHHSTNQIREEIRGEVEVHKEEDEEEVYDEYEYEEEDEAVPSSKRSHGKYIVRELTRKT